MFAAGMSVLAVEAVCDGLTADALTPEAMLSWQQWRLMALSLLPGLWLVFSLSYARGNARESLVRWRAVWIGALVLPFALAVGFRQDLALAVQQEPETGHWVLRLGLPGIGLELALLLGSIVVLMNLERTFRASVGTMRWRIKFMLLGIAALFLVRLYTSSQAMLFRGFDLSVHGINSAALLVASLLVLRALFRTGHFEMDVYPSQSILQSSLTVLLTGIYLLMVGALAKVVTYFGGDATFGFKAFLLLVALTLLALLLQSDRVRLRLRQFVSRNFQRPLYDYRAVWRRFAEATATHVEQEDLCASLARLTADMFQTLSVTIWLVDEKKASLGLAASTSLSDARAWKIHPHGADAAEVIRHVKSHPEPEDIEFTQEQWASALRRCHPDEFHKGGTRVCLPIIGGGEVLALITLGDRVSGAPFSLQDFDLLKCIGDQAAASLLNARLSRKLLEARELEAFQAMAAFFVHDLKNAASTLNLMLQNLPVHFDDPAFREDALRGIAKTVAHINGLIGRLGLLRRELKIQPVPTDLNEVVAAAIATLEKAPDSVLIKDLHPLPKVPCDPEQMLKVVTNLVLNASEAVTGAGQVRVTTSLDSGSAVLTVADSGCGMSVDFLSRSLFRPFQTTKKNGLGIGMFQSKMIVEAHGGRIEVASEPNKGTTFRVFLPTTPSESSNSAAPSVQSPAPDRIPDAWTPTDHPASANRR